MDKARILKELIEKTGLSLKAFAEKIGMPYTTVYSILERGVGKASVDNIIKICKALGMSVEELEQMAKGCEREKSRNLFTIAAHHDGNEWTDEELEDIDNFIKFVKSRRKK